MLSPAQLWCVNTDLVAGEVVDGEAVIINLSNGMYYTMDKVGADVWQLLERGRSLDAMADEIAVRYGVDRESVLADLRLVIDELVAEGLIVSRNGRVPADEAGRGVGRGRGAVYETLGHPLHRHERGARTRPAAAGAGCQPGRQALTGSPSR